MSEMGRLTEVAERLCELLEAQDERLHELERSLDFLAERISVLPQELGQ